MCRSQIYSWAEAHELVWGGYFLMLDLFFLPPSRSALLLFSRKPGGPGPSWPPAFAVTSERPVGDETGLLVAADRLSGGSHTAAIRHLVPNRTARKPLSARSRLLSRFGHATHGPWHSLFAKREVGGCVTGPSPVRTPRARRKLTHQMASPGARTECPNHRLGPATERHICTRVALSRRAGLQPRLPPSGAWGGSALAWSSDLELLRAPGCRWPQSGPCTERKPAEA